MSEKPAKPANKRGSARLSAVQALYQMDIGGAILAKEIANGRVVTVAVDGMTFHHPVSVGHVVCCYGKCARIGTTSMTIKLEVWVKPVMQSSGGERYCVTEAIFTYVAIDENGRPRKVKPDANN